MADNLPSAAKMKQNGAIVIKVNDMDIRECCTDSAFNNNENIQTVTFLIDGGYGSSWVAGMQPKLNMTGKYVKDNAFCAYLASIEYGIGEDRIAECSIEKFGTTVTCGCTLENVAIGGGTALEGAPLSFVIAFNGKPTVTTTPTGGSGGSDPSDP